MADGRVFPQLVDPFKAIDDAIDDDPILLQLGRLLSAWATQIGLGFPSKLTVKALVKQSYSSSNPTPGKPTQAVKVDPDNPPLREVLEEIAGVGFSGQINNKKLGGYLGSFAGKVIDGRRLCAGEPYQHAATWWVEDVGEFGESVLAPTNKKNKSNVSQIRRVKSDSQNSQNSQNSPDSPTPLKTLASTPKAA